MSHPVHLILSPGTRIVTRHATNRIGGGPLLAAGAVAVITVSPVDAQHAYKVRCNDGAEAMLRRNEFSILKEFKNEEAVGRESSRADTDFQHWQPFIIYRCVVASPDTVCMKTGALRGSRRLAEDQTPQPKGCKPDRQQPRAKRVRERHPGLWFPKKFPSPERATEILALVAESRVA